jgi:MFS-type transporter involved in bile tolerance (Atg22 family)
MMLTAALALWAGAALAGPFGGHPVVFIGLAVLTVAAAVLVLTDTELARAHR